MIERCLKPWCGELCMRGACTAAHRTLCTVAVKARLGLIRSCVACAFAMVRARTAATELMRIAEKRGRRQQQSQQDNDDRIGGKTAHHRQGRQRIHLLHFHNKEIGNGCFVLPCQFSTSERWFLFLPVLLFRTSDRPRMEAEGSFEQRKVACGENKRATYMVALRLN